MAYRLFCRSYTTGEIDCGLLSFLADTLEHTTYARVVSEKAKEWKEVGYDRGTRRRHRKGEDLRIGYFKKETVLTGSALVRCPQFRLLRQTSWLGLNMLDRA